MYQNNLKNIALSFTFFKALRGTYLSWEPGKMNVKFHKNCENTAKIREI